jgi:endo-1,4-beta-mannosidase
LASRLTVSNDFVLLDGKRYRGIGANYFSLASRALKNPDDSSSLSNLTVLARLDIPFVRFMCGGYWPAEQRLYLTNRTAFFERLDRVVHAAETNHIGLVPSLFWHLPTVSDLVNEPLQSLGNTKSRSIAYICSYTTDIVSRYRTSPAIWGWEFGNEAALAADLPNAASQRPPVVPELGTPTQRDRLDELKSAQLLVAYREFAAIVRRLDPERLVLSGNALPRVSSWHNTHETNWVPDTVEQFGEILRRDNGDPFNAISVHVYADDQLPAGAKSIPELLKILNAEAASIHKPLFIGEFGVSRRRAGSFNEQKNQFAKLLAAIEQADVPLSAFWVFDLPEQNGDWNITADNDGTILLNMVSEANRPGRTGHSP